MLLVSVYKIKIGVLSLNCYVRLGLTKNPVLFDKICPQIEKSLKPI